MVASPAWMQYYILVAEIAVGLAGILFVSIQLTRDRWQHDKIMRYLVLETFSELLVPIFIALSVLLPARWPIGWEPPHMWLLHYMAVLQVSTISSIWQIVGIAASVFGWSAAVRTTFTFVTSRRDRHPHTSSSSNSHPQLWLEVIPLGITFPLLFFSSLRGDLGIVGILTLWFIFSAMFETWLIFAKPPAQTADSPARATTTIQLQEVTEISRTEPDG